MKNMKRIIAVVMAICMIFALSATVFATNNILSAATTFIPGSLYSQTAAKGSTVYLYATVVTDAYPSSLIGFSSQAEAAANVNWTITEGSSKVYSISSSGESFVYNNVTYYASKCTVVLKNNATPGTIYINAVGQNGAPTNADCNYVIMVEDYNNVSGPVSSIDIEVRDLGSQSVIASMSGEIVKAACSTPNGRFNGSSGAAQTYPTAANTVDNLLTLNSVTSIVTTYGYVSSMTILDDSYDPVVYPESYNPITYDYIGWMYGVLRMVNNSYRYVSASEGISATAFELQAGDKVVWVYGTFAQATAYFAQFNPFI